MHVKQTQLNKVTKYLFRPENIHKPNNFSIQRCLLTGYFTVTAIKKKKLAPFKHVKIYMMRVKKQYL